MTFKWSLDKNLFWKETNRFIFLKIEKQQLYCQINVNINFLPSNRNKARTYSALKTERFQMMFIVWHSI